MMTTTHLLRTRARELTKSNKGQKWAHLRTVRNKRLTFVTDLVPSEIACLASSPGRMRRTAVWISRDEIVDFLEYDASSATRALSLEVRNGMRGTRTGGFCSNALENVVHERVEDGHRLVRDTRVRVDLLEDYVAEQHITRQHQTRLIVAEHVAAPRTLVDVGAVRLLADLLALLLLALSARRRLAWCLLCCLSLRLRRLGGGGGCGSLARGRSRLSRPNQRPISSNPTSTRPHHPTTPLNRIKKLTLGAMFS